MLRSLPLGEWPNSDREAWEAACRPALRLKRGGSAAHFAPQTRHDLQKRYGYFLTFLKESGRFDPITTCASLLIPDNIDALIRRMRHEWSAITLMMTVLKLKQIGRHLAPAANLKWLSRVAGDLNAEGGPVRRPPVVDASELVVAGLTLVEEYSAPEAPMDLTRALAIRNGLMIALLASCPIRAKNLTGLTLGQSLHISQSSWWIDLPGSETKNGRPDMRMLPDFLMRALELYLRQARPFLMRQAGRQVASSDTFADGSSKITGFVSALNGWPERDDGTIGLAELSGPVWISRYGRPMPYSSIANAIVSVTKATIGTAISPHGFRYAAATTAAWKAGSMPHLASGILQHQDRRITEASYIRATSFEAAQHLGTILRRS
ncbi:MAG: tyrosine-type recombinase/integrase [Methylocapsa sp.]|nr:tyrosine-type recombinase/integrase [Methylocapsa sp.]